MFKGLIYFHGNREMRLFGDPGLDLDSNWMFDDWDEYFTDEKWTR